MMFFTTFFTSISLLGISSEVWNQCGIREKTRQSFYKSEIDNDLPVFTTESTVVPHKEAESKKCIVCIYVDNFNYDKSDKLIKSLKSLNYDYLVIYKIGFEPTKKDPDLARFIESQKKIRIRQFMVFIEGVTSKEKVKETTTKLYGLDFTEPPPRKSHIPPPPPPDESNIKR